LSRTLPLDHFFFLALPPDLFTGSLSFLADFLLPVVLGRRHCSFAKMSDKDIKKKKREAVILICTSCLPLPEPPPCWSVLRIACHNTQRDQPAGAWWTDFLGPPLHGYNPQMEIVPPPMKHSAIHFRVSHTRIATDNLLVQARGAAGYAVIHRTSSYDRNHLNELFQHVGGTKVEERWLSTP
jgi:hypothetical protein